MQKYLSWEKVVLIILYFQEMQLPMMWEGFSTNGFFKKQCKKITKKKLQSKKIIKKKLLYRLKLGRITIFITMGAKFD